MAASSKQKQKNKDSKTHKRNHKQKQQKKKPSSLGVKSTKPQKPLKKSNKLKPKKTKEIENGITKIDKDIVNSENQSDDVLEPPTPTATASQQLSYFIQQYQSANRVQLSSLELDSLTEKRMLELCQDQDTRNLGELLKVAFGESWREVLYEKQSQEGKVEPGNPAVLVISASAIRSLELLRELRSLTEECKAAKLFAKHMKIEEQVSFLKNRVNVASGTPSRIKKLIDTEALGLSRLSVVVLDLHADVKGYSLLTLPQVRDEFWELYRTYFHQRLLEGDLRICLYGKLPNASKPKKLIDAE